MAHTSLTFNPYKAHVSHLPLPPPPMKVLLQRSDVETFLLSSLHIVRKEMERGSLMQPQGVGGRDAHHPSATSSAPSPGPSNTEFLSSQHHQRQGLGAGSLDIKELPWEDRERILRLLFAKINNQSQQAHFSNLPQHPLGGEGPAGGTATGMYGSGTAGMYGLYSAGIQPDMA